MASKLRKRRCVSGSQKIRRETNLRAKCLGSRTSESAVDLYNGRGRI